MTRYYFDATPDRHRIVLINAATVRKAAALIETCEHCNEEGSEFPFVVILDRVTGSDPKVTDYILEVPQIVLPAAARFAKRPSFSAPRYFAICHCREVFKGRYATRSALNELSHRLSPTGMAVAVPV